MARAAFTVAVLGVLPDIDFLVNRHSRETHSLGATVCIAALAWSWGHAWAGLRPHPTRKQRARWAAACAAAYASHILLDWLGSDTAPPIGIQALWPFTNGFYESDLHVFYAVDRRYWLPGFFESALRTLSWELVVLGPLAVLAWWLASQPTRRAPTASPPPTSTDPHAA